MFCAAKLLINNVPTIFYNDYFLKFNQQQEQKQIKTGQNKITDKKNRKKTGKKEKK